MLNAESPTASSRPFRGELEIDAAAVCDALQSEVVVVTGFQLASFAEVLRSLPRGTANFAGSSDEVSRGAPIPSELVRRLFHACAIIFDEEAVGDVHAFLRRNLGRDGLLRLRRPADVEG